MTTPDGFATTPEPPYYAVIFTSLRRAEAGEVGNEGNEYAAVAARMSDLAARQPGYLGAESARGDDGLGITVSYWASLDDIAHWKADVEHVAAQTLGRERWYARYALRVARVERALDFAA